MLRAGHPVIRCRSRGPGDERLHRGGDPFAVDAKIFPELSLTPMFDEPVGNADPFDPDVIYPFFCQEFQNRWP